MTLVAAPAGKYTADTFELVGGRESHSHSIPPVVFPLSIQTRDVGETSDSDADSSALSAAAEGTHRVANFYWLKPVKTGKTVLPVYQ